MIVATRMPQSPRNLLEQLLADADLDGWARVPCSAASICSQSAALTAAPSATTSGGASKWWPGQHRYWTAYGKACAGKQGAQHRSHPGDGGERALTRRLGRTGALLNL